MRSLLVLAIVPLVTIAAAPQTSPDEAAVRNIVQEQITAWNSGDAAAYSRHFAADGTFTNIRGQFFTGREPFIQRHDYLFKGPFRGSTLKQNIVSVWNPSNWNGFSGAMEGSPRGSGRLAADKAPLDH